MYPGKFEYHRPGGVDEVLALLARHGEDARVLAGGHSLVPMMKLRLAQPRHLVDINRIDALKGIREEGGEIVIGAATTQAELQISPILRERCPLVVESSAVIADPQVRYCGTVGGNVANGDPGNDHPAVMMALGATYVLRSEGGERRVAARDFYLGTYETALETGELLTGIRVPASQPGQGASYEKLKRKVGDYATAATAVVLTLADGVCRSAAIALTNVAPTPLYAADASASLAGKAIDEAAIDEAARLSMAITEPAEDLRGDAEYRTAMAGEMTRRAIRNAAARA